MQYDSLFGHLASRSGHPENVATDALNYILNRSSVARRAFLEYARQADVELPDTLMFGLKRLETITLFQTWAERIRSRDKSFWSKPSSGLGLRVTSRSLT